jgi:hypothetical protein
MNAFVFAAFLLGLGAGMHVCSSIPDIRDYIDTPYCETKTVNGKEFMRCLKAIEVNEDGK